LIVTKYSVDQELSRLPETEINKILKQKMNKMELYTYYNLDECIDRAIIVKDWNLIKMKVK
jgi:hypothetical protein